MKWRNLRKNFSLPVKDLAEMVSLGITPNLPLQDRPSAAHTVPDTAGAGGGSIPAPSGTRTEDVNLITQKEKFEAIQLMNSKTLVKD